jgi:hypothetical protein
MQTVAQTQEFARRAADAGMDDGEIEALVAYLAEHPMAGDEIAGTGGCRKLRWARPGKGKSGGYRAITFYSGPALPVILLTVYAKSQKANLSRKQRNELRQLTKAIADTYASRVTTAKRRTP